MGAGNGLNFAHYPPGVSRVIALEPEAHLRMLARARAARATVPVDVVAGVAGNVPVHDRTCDAGVASLVLCSVPDQQAALREMYRVVKPGGELRFFEHVRGEGRALRGLQRLLDATVWPALGGGCHAGRDTTAAIEIAGFEITQIDRFSFPDLRIQLPTSPHILGVGTRTSDRPPLGGPP